MNDHPPIASLTLPELFACLQVASEINWGAAKSVLMQRISRLLDLPGQAAVPPCAAEDGAVCLTTEQARAMSLAAIDARFRARDAGQSEKAQFMAALGAAASVLGPQVSAPTTLDLVVARLLAAYDDRMARHGPADGPDHAAGALDAAVGAARIALSAAARS